jgi:hypothetical protein
MIITVNKRKQPKPESFFLQNMKSYIRTNLCLLLFCCCFKEMKYVCMQGLELENREKGNITFGEKLINNVNV